MDPFTMFAAFLGSVLNFSDGILSFMGPLTYVDPSTITPLSKGNYKCTAEKVLFTDENTGLTLRMEILYHIKNGKLYTEEDFSLSGKGLLSLLSTTGPVFIIQLWDKNVLDRSFHLCMAPLGCTDLNDTLGITGLLGGFLNEEDLRDSTFNTVVLPLTIQTHPHKSVASILREVNFQDISCRRSFSTFEEVKPKVPAWVNLLEGTLGEGNTSVKIPPLSEVVEEVGVRAS